MRGALLGAIAFVLLAACGGDDAPVGPGRGPAPVEKAKVVRARAEIRQLRAAVEQYQAFRGDWPDGWSDLDRTGVDPWDNEYALAIVDGRPRVTSAGPDGEHGTADDVVGEDG